jgi:hypothetical protein
MIDDDGLHIVGPMPDATGMLGAPGGALGAGGVAFETPPAK